ncbi:MAG: cell division protein, partial [Telluria sp.]
MSFSESISAAPESLHPSLWRASQLARSHSRCIDTGHA